MKVLYSPLTKKFLKEAYDRYGEIGLFWGSQVLLTSSYIATDHKWLFMKFGSSGAGKTISDLIALEAFGKRLKPLKISGRLTPAGVVKMMKKAEKSKRAREDLRKFKEARLIFVEDLSRCTTHYLKLTSIQFLAGLTRNTSLDDLTSEGGTLGEKLGEEPKKAMVAGTPSDWEEIASTSLYEEFIDRRSLTCIALMRPEEWRQREQRAISSSSSKPDWLIIREWVDMIREADVNPYFGPMRMRKIGPARDSLYKKLKAFKKYPENLLMMIDSLAEGHARINGRDIVLPEDYEVLDKIFSRFLQLADMKKKELYIVEEIVRSDYGTLSIQALTYLLRVRARRKGIPELKMVQRTVYNYVSMSKYLTKNRASKNNPAFVSLSPYLQNIFKEWRKEIGELIQ